MIFSISLIQLLSLSLSLSTHTIKPQSFLYNLFLRTFGGVLKGEIESAIEGTVKLNLNLLNDRLRAILQMDKVRRLMSHTTSASMWAQPFLRGLTKSLGTTLRVEREEEEEASLLYTKKKKKKKKKKLPEAQQASLMEGIATPLPEVQTTTTGLSSM